MALQPLHQFRSSSSPAASERQAKEVLSAKHAQEWTCGTYGAGFAPWSSAYARQRGHELDHHSQRHLPIDTELSRQVQHIA